MSTTVTVTENTVAVTDSGGTAVVTVSSSPVTVTTSTSPFRHASTHGPAGTDPITALGNLTIGTATMTGGTATGMTINTATIGSAVMTAGTATSLALVTPTVGTATITGGTATNLSLVTPTIGTATMTGGTATSVTLGAATFSNAASFGTGSAGTPSVTFTGDTNTGIYSPGADQVAIATAGTLGLVVNSASNVGLNGITPATNINLHVEKDSASNVRFGMNTDDANGLNLQFVKRRGTNAAGTVVQAGDELGKLYFYGYDGTTLRAGAAIVAAVDATPGASDMPGRLLFYTTADGAASPTERMRIDNAGLITGTGTSLGAWTSYTPTLGGTGWAIGNGAVAGYYCQVGKLVFFIAIVTLGSTSTAGGAARPSISLPVTARAQQFSLLGETVDASAGAIYVTHWRYASTTTVDGFYVASGGQSTSILSTAPFTFTTSDTFRVNGVYEAA